MTTVINNWTMVNPFWLLRVFDFMLILTLFVAARSQ
jgi:hypothetical protein